MDPVSIGVAAAALLGSKAVEEFATQAGSTAWVAVQRLGASVRTRLSPQGAHALDQLTAAPAAGAGAAEAAPASAAGATDGAATAGEALGGTAAGGRALGSAAAGGRAPDGVSGRGAGPGAAAGGVAAAEARAVLAGEIETAVRADPGFRAELEALISDAGRGKPLAGVMAVARDHAKQVNVGGDNSGPISF